jgi:nucleoside-diphosphate-sugar epimerase
LQDQSARWRTKRILDEVGWKPGNPEERAMWAVASADSKGYHRYKSVENEGAAAVGSLICVLADPDDRSFCDAVESLGRIRDPRAVPSLVAELLNKRRWHRSHSIGEALKSCGWRPQNPLERLFYAFAEADYDVIREHVSTHQQTIIELLAA